MGGRVGGTEKGVWSTSVSVMASLSYSIVCVQSRFTELKMDCPRIHSNVHMGDFVATDLNAGLASVLNNIPCLSV